MSKKIKKSAVSAKKREENTLSAIEECVQRIATPKERDYFRDLLTGLVRNKSVPVELLKHIPIQASDAGKTRFDQIYDAILNAAFPTYRPETLRRLLGPHSEIKKTIKIWRAVFPEKFGVSSILLRADDYQQAFALACDYALRSSLRVYKMTPSDLTIRVMFVSEKSIERMLDIRWSSRVNKRQQLQLQGRKFTPKEIGGMRLAALGSPKQPRFRVLKYAEMKDLDKILQENKLMKTSEVESETFRKKR